MKTLCYIFSTVAVLTCTPTCTASSGGNHSQALASLVAISIILSPARTAVLANPERVRLAPHPVSKPPLTQRGKKKTKPTFTTRKPRKPVVILQPKYAGRSTKAHHSHKAKIQP